MAVSTLPDWIKPGARFRLVRMGDDPDPIPAGAMGTITQVVSCACIGDSDWQFWVDWDPEVNRSLSLVWPADEIEPV